jgi:hypothetical protein
MDLKIPSKFMGATVTTLIEQTSVAQTNQIINSEVAPVTPQFLEEEYMFTAEVNTGDVIALPVTLTANMKIISIWLGFDVDYPLFPAASTGTENVGNWDFGTDQEPNTQFLGGFSMYSPYTSIRPLMWIPSAANVLQIKCQHFNPTTEGLTGHKVKVVVEYLQLSAP